MSNSKAIITCCGSGCNQKMVITRDDGQKLTHQTIMHFMDQFCWVEKDGEYWCPACVRALGRNLRQYAGAMAK
jgi:hypothetical protein